MSPLEEQQRADADAQRSAGDDPGGPPMIDPNDFARTLERELSDLQQSILDLSHPNILAVLKERDALTAQLAAAWQNKCSGLEQVYLDVAAAILPRTDGVCDLVASAKSLFADRDRLQAELAASEQRETGLRKALTLCKDLLPRGLDAKEWVAIKAALSTPPSTALEDYVRPLVEALKLAVECMHDKTKWTTAAGVQISTALARYEKENQQ